MARDVRGRALGEEAALVEHGDAVGQLEHHPHVVLDQHDRVAAVAVQAADQAGDLVGLLVAHPRGRLVQQQQPRLQRQRHRDLGGALIAVRHLAHQPVGLGGETGQCHDAADLAPHRGRRVLPEPGAQPVAGADLDRDAHVLAHRELGKDLRHLEGAAHAELDALLRRQPRDRPAVEHDLARGGREEAGDQVEERRLARTIGADDGAQFARRDAERYLAHRDQAAECLGDAADLQHGTHAALRRRSIPSRPRGKNSTTSTNSRPMKLIQFTVIDEM